MFVRCGWWPEDIEDNPSLPEFIEIPDDTPQDAVGLVIRRTDNIGVRPRSWAGPFSEEEIAALKESEA